MSGALARSPTDRLLAPALATAAVMAILVGLGVWQLERLAWKRGLLAQIDRAESLPAVPLDADPEAFRKVSVVGMWGAEAATYGSEVRDTPAGSRIGAYLLMPLERAGRPTVIVNRGWAPTEQDRIAPRDAGAPAHVEGYVRQPEGAGAFAANDPGAHRFFNLDPAAIGLSLGVADPAPFTLVQLGAAAAGEYPAPSTTLPRPPNDHLSYAITWFSLAAVAAVIFLVHSRKVLRTP